ncbi:SRPBCC domain-containing protein [Actinomadura rugatobispora]|uniref:SRPBCC domain-containing protein n=1 Tax=Actinomadura rugatobispora TaxID=1994 RepID=A0ABW1AC72_9ACTN|nr:SRPBCC family protein [Actinomadura rugatobispora]
MARHELGDERTGVVAEGDELIVERVFPAPPALVWAAMTSAEHIPHWWGPHGTTAEVTEMDVRPGGRWRIGDGATVVFTGEFLEVDPPARFVRTSAPEAAAGAEPEKPPAVETVTFEEVEGGTSMRYQARFPSEEVLDYAVSVGMTKGVLEQFDRLQELLTPMP